MENHSLQIEIKNNIFFPAGVDILVPTKVANKLEILNGSIIVRFGSRRTSTKIERDHSPTSTLYVSKSLADRLMIPFSSTLQVRFLPIKKELDIGPLLGILITKANLQAELPFGLYTSFCEEACEAAQRVDTLCYVLTLDQITQGESSAKGWIKQENEWKEYHLPLPRVIYNRLTNRIREGKGPILDQINKLKEAGITIFNERFLNKWDVYQKLMQTEMSIYLPSTDLFKQSNALQSMIGNFPILFLKPVHGSEGKGIYRIRKASTGFFIDHTIDQGYETLHYDTFTEMVNTLAPKLKKKSYLVQQGIPFISWNGGTIDFRALAQKNLEGNWRIVSLIGRMGSSKTFVSNLAQGGKLEGATSMIKLLKSTYPLLPTAQQIKKAAIEIATALDSQLDGNYGELGIDLGIDITGRIWLIEVNSKPSKKNEGVLESTKRPRPSVLHLFEYVNYLAGFGNTLT